MKFSKICILAMAAFAAYACAKSDEVDTSSVNPETQVSVEDADIQCIDGTLHFPSPESCFKTMDALVSDEDLSSFEKEHNFTSVRSFTDSMLDELIECETPEEYQAILETCSDYLVEEDGRLMPKIVSFAYASIADINGVFYVDGIKHTVSGDKIMIETTDPATRASVVKEIDYVAPMNANSETRGETNQKYYDNRYQKGKYKVFGRTHILRMVIAKDGGHGTIVYESSFAMELQLSGQKKKTLIGWNTYSDKFTITHLSFEVWIGGKHFYFNPDRKPFSLTSGSTKSFKHRIAIGGLWVSSPEVLMPIPENFYMIRWRALSGALGNCGAVTEEWRKGMPSIMLPLSNCM